MRWTWDLFRATFSMIKDIAWLISSSTTVQQHSKETTLARGAQVLAWENAESVMRRLISLGLLPLDAFG